MARPAQITTEMEQEAMRLVKRAKTARELRTGLSVLLPKQHGLTNAGTGESLGVSIATILRMQKEIRQRVDGTAEQKRKWGGRRRQLMTVEEEKAFLEPWVAEAEKGGVLIVPPIHKALIQACGRTIAPSTVYRLLARHGWRKIAPDTYHPKRDAAAQDDFKKNSAKQWRNQREKTPPPPRPE
jgi:transposase